MQKEGQWLLQENVDNGIRAAIDRFLRVEHNKPFSIYGSPVLSEANLVLDTFVKDLRKTGKIGGIVDEKSLRTNYLRSSGLTASVNNFHGCSVQIHFDMNPTIN